MSPQVTIPIAANADDLYLDAASATYPVAGPATVVGGTQECQPGRSLEGGTSYKVRNALVRFDSSAIPDNATIDSANLLLQIINYASTNALNLIAESYAWTGVAADWTANEFASPCINYAMSNIPGSGLATVPFSSVSVINKTGITSLRMSISKRASDAAPTGENYFNFASLENTTLAEAKLEVNYTLDATPPAAPTGLTAVKSAA